MTEPSIGRPVRVVSISFAPGKGIEEIAGLVEAEAARGADLITLPETCLGQSGIPERLEGRLVSAMKDLAGRHRCHVVCPIDRTDGERRLNSVVVLDRRGRVSCVYDKIYPYWSEYDLKPPVRPGRDAAVFEADFGRVGFATCFDVNFPSVWDELAGLGAELVVWPSAYSAGSSLQAHAINHHYYIVTSTYRCDCLVYDITGSRMLYEQRQPLNVTRVTLDLDRGIYHQNFNLGKRDKLLKEHGSDVEQEQWMELEQWFVLRAKRPGVSARGLARDYGLEELRAYLRRSRVAIDALRAGG
ncbi:MAG: carbon-nitrogen hydrolase family protein [Planctomycetes bacterium]|nr:carbon-nitrogen hydrolase family protein [Planctomycetota bacterium]